ncbi:preprotein translocase subunit SecY [Candidatus Falkowbacteria bacterium RIFOXYD2_FULL_35_9]|uniref:Protein translocase subunit SecY n=1 Tax=Candidatus Falkowbacteria bacterium RIFOXYC2_FULL_36_12 TaxID=1798002 RepID=A0A1F5SW56_9BACT|nr:MAG: preprotein translocase subunit SecY [Candidatus Falkowbacteria bacterium RIFOXYC2_FULL_36_12]OGF34393.1 MAG: preprotein translocase subunit SecY [Candidatus Falkowbacteria bacterium RIFOXYA2_FULL_35_8]OGF47289.1 MAG: preprotein translocase subunit SecY [Candidatus Falkowbacteria bacterium RIFOXYD2_FULL_35_9]
MWQKLSQIWKIKELRNSILYILAMLVVFRFAAHIPIPGINVENLREFFSSNQLLGLLNLFSGGGMENFSVVMMGVAPYITASIIFQLLAMIVPKLEEMNKDEAGRHKISSWTRWATVPLAALQGYAMIQLLLRAPKPILENLNLFTYITTLLTITAGTVFLMWIGELITERKIGNGISLLIFAGIIVGIPKALQQIFINFSQDQLITLIVFAVVAVITVVGVVFISEGQRNIPVSYAKRIRGNRMYGGTNTHLPLRVNQAGVIPIIFAISVVLFPSMIAQFMVQAKTEFIVSIGTWVTNLFQNNLFYGVLYFLLVFAFTYFYTAVIFHPSQIAENLQKSGAFIPGIRPGKQTEEYLQNTISRITLTGALFLALIAILPLILQNLFNMDSMVVGGTSILIVVAVVIEIVKQIESQMEMREYDKL